MHVILVRHGKAQNGQTDSERSLSQDGYRTVENLGMRLKKEAEQISQIWHSHLLRAKQTAEILCRYLLPEEGLKAESFLTPHSDPLTVRSMLESEARSLLIVSHLPFLEYLANLLVTGQPESREEHVLEYDCRPAGRSGEAPEKHTSLETDLDTES